MNAAELSENQFGTAGPSNAAIAPLGQREAALLDWICRTVSADALASQIRFAELSIGDGQLSRSVARTFPSSIIDCIDISPSRLDHCHRISCAESPTLANRLRFIELDLDSQFCELERERYDVVLAIDILEHVFDVFGFVQNCQEILKPNGWLFLRVPNLTYFKRRCAVLCGRLPVTSSWFETPGSYDSWKERHGWDGGHLHFFTIDAMRWLLANEGFESFTWRDVGAKAELIRRLWPGMLLGNLAISIRKSVR
jgi:cyclopropane fatty-acyl-phospholipid synthase-like methyltransferase